jgi:phosphoglycolate phosphatase-like HAD superfamily hydrolase
VEELHNFEPKNEYLIAINSDGCAFDTMEIKHKKCFIPNTIKIWELQSVSKYVRAVAEFVNLYSKWRGLNRFPALVKTLDLLRVWPEANAHNVDIPNILPLREWISKTENLGNPSLEREVNATRDVELRKVLDWSISVNNNVREMVVQVPPFPFVRDSLKRISSWADIIVCSATPYNALKREWEEHDLARFVSIIAGQEQGSKTQHLKIITERKYNSDKVLMIGDAPGDLSAAYENKVDFYPINPGEEEMSWKYFLENIADRFKNGEYNQSLEKKLPDKPTWN